MPGTSPQRRAFLLATATGLAGLALPHMAAAATASAHMRTRQVEAGLLDAGVHEAGPEDGRPVILLHGFPYDIHSFSVVAPMLAARGLRVIVPYLRGHGSTRFLDPATPRSGQQAALGQDVIDLMDALHIPEAVVAGFDWGGNAACVAAALRPTRVVGLVSVNGYLIHNIAGAAAPGPAQAEAGLWYQYYFQTERGRAGLASNRRAIARLLWTNNSPTWKFSDATFKRSAAAFDNPDFVDIVTHSYRHRLGLAPGDPAYAEAERKLALQPPLAAPAITLDGKADGLVPATDGRAMAAKFSGWRSHRQIAAAGHNLPQEAPAAFASAVHELVRGGKWRT